jgi:hypothetical protein
VLTSNPPVILKILFLSAQFFGAGHFFLSCLMSKNKKHKRVIVVKLGAKRWGRKDISLILPAYIYTLYIPTLYRGGIEVIYYLPPNHGIKDCSMMAQSVAHLGI